MRCDGWHRDLDLSPVARAHIAPERFDAARRHATPDADRQMPLPMRRLPLAVVMCAALKAMIVANEFLELEVCELKQAVSHAFVRGRFKTGLTTENE